METVPILIYKIKSSNQFHIEEFDTDSGHLENQIKRIQDEFHEDDPITSYIVIQVTVDYDQEAILNFLNDNN
jgi:hypothetical protein